MLHWLRIPALFSVALIGVVPASGADTDGSRRPPIEFRRHLTVNDARGSAIYALTEITTVTDAGTSGALLVHETLTNQRFVMSHKFDVAAHRTSNQVSDVAGKKYVRMSLDLPSAAKTRDDLAGELEANPELLNMADVIITIETTGFSQSVRDSKIREGLSRRALSDLRESLDPSFLEGLERMRAELFATDVGKPFYATLGRLLFHGGCEAATSDQKVVAESPDCDFDKSFGYPCTDAQEERIAKAKAEKRTLTRYW
jgi:hypothetical protein